MLCLVVAVSGCSPSNVEEGPEQSDPATSSESDRSITVEEISVDPAEIYDGSVVNSRVEFANSGTLPGRVRVGKQGRNILSNYCPDTFSITGFDGSSSNTNLELLQYDLEPGQKLQLEWRLRERDDNRVPLYGQRCNLQFTVPFNYSVESYRQIQIKQSDQVEGSRLNAESTRGPLLFAIETVGGTGDEGKSTYVEGRDDFLQILLQIRNQEADEHDKGVVDIDEESLKVTANGPGPLGFTEGWDQMRRDGSTCSADRNETLRMFEGQSRVITCNIDLSGTTIRSPSRLVEINANVNYTYEKTIGTRQVEILSRGQ